MKKIAYIIAEYNPFHKGHEYQIKKTLELTRCDHLAVIMSGDYVQRGEPAVLSSEIRAGIAVEHGADIVFELPLPYATASSDYFALGAMKMIKSLGGQAVISFGSESGDLKELKEAARIMVENDAEMFSTIRKLMGKGESMPRAREKAMEMLGLEDVELLRRSNNILGVEYIKHGMRLMGDDCSFVTVKRVGAGYNDGNTGSMMSATGIRKDRFKGGSSWRSSVPDDTEAAMDGKPCFGDIKMLEMLRYSVLKEGAKIRRFRGVVDGLENRIAAAVKNAEKYEDAVNAVCTKRYPKTAVKRIFLSIILGIEKNEFDEVVRRNIPYINVISYGRRSRELLKEIKERARCPILRRGKKYPCKKWYANTETVDRYRNMEHKAAHIYRMLCDGS